MGAERAVCPGNPQCEAINRGLDLRSGHTIVPHRFGWQYINGNSSDTSRSLVGRLLKGSSLLPSLRRKSFEAEKWADNVGASIEIALLGSPVSPVIVDGPCAQKTVGFLARVADHLYPAPSDTKTQCKKQGTIAPPLPQVFGRMERSVCSSVISVCQKVTAPRSWTSNGMP